MKRNENRIGLQDIVNGLLFALQADGRAVRTIGYYRDLLRHFLDYAQSKGWENDLTAVDTHRLREFLAWVGSRTCEYTIGNGTKRVRKANPTTAWPYYRALRRLFNWAV